MAGAPGFIAEDSIPVAPGALYGARAFRVNHEGKLSAAAWRYDWTDGVNKATCKIYERTIEALSLHSHYDKPVLLTKSHPMSECEHGFWAYYHGHNEYYDGKIDSLPVAGIVKGYGESILGERGFRTEKAEIVALTVPSADKLLFYVLHSTFYQSLYQFNALLNKGRRAFMLKLLDIIIYGVLSAFLAYSLTTLATLLFGFAATGFTGNNYFMPGQLVALAVGVLYGTWTVFSYTFRNPKKLRRKYREEIEALIEDYPFYAKLMALATGAKEDGKQPVFAQSIMDGGTYCSLDLLSDQSETNKFIIQHFTELYPSAKIYTDYGEMVQDYKHLIKNPNALSDDEVGGDISGNISSVSGDVGVNEGIEGNVSTVSGDVSHRR